MPDKLYTTNQLAKLFGVVPTTVIDWIERGKLDAFKTLGGHRRITHAAVMSFLALHRLPAPPAFGPALAHPEAGGGPAPGRVMALLSEDGPWAEAAASQLERALPPVRLLAAHHPAAGLLAIGAERPALVVLDRRLAAPGIEDLGRQIKEFLGPDRVRIIALSDGDPGAAFASADAVVPRGALAALVETCRSFLAAAEPDVAPPAAGSA